LRLASHAPLSPWRLAQHLELPVFALSEFVKLNARAAYLLTTDGAREFSGATVNLGYRRLIVVNDGHSKKRQASDLSHELSHSILHHRSGGDAKSNGVRSYDPDQEEEANWLGPALLVSEEAALWKVRKNMSKSEASDHYSATEEVVQMRLNLTGALKRVRS
jgi:Zn-dependent peptidase ImmA (M78 family)